MRLTFEVGGETWSVRKRFLQKAEVVLEGPRLRATGDEAEEKLQELLGFTRTGNRGADARGASGVSLGRAGPVVRARCAGRGSPSERRAVWPARSAR